MDDLHDVTERRGVSAVVRSRGPDWCCHLQFPPEGTLDEGVKEITCLFLCSSEHFASFKQLRYETTKLVLQIDGGNWHCLFREVAFVQYGQRGMSGLRDKTVSHQSHAKHAIPVIDLGTKVNRVYLLVER